MKLREVTDRSWLVEDGDNVGLISEKNSGGYLVISNHNTDEFPDQESLNRHFRKDVFGEIQVMPLSEPQVEHTVRGYPVNYQEPLPYDQEHELPLYTKRQPGGVPFCAGHYAMITPKGWRTVFCPKLVTLEEYEYLGPFHTRREAQRAARNDPR